MGSNPTSSANFAFQFFPICPKSLIFSHYSGPTSPGLSYHAHPYPLKKGVLERDSGNAGNLGNTVLTDAQINKVKPAEKAHRLVDGNGLHLFVPLGAENCVAIGTR